MLQVHLQKQILFDSFKKSLNRQLKLKWSSKVKKLIAETSWFKKQLTHNPKLPSNLYPSFGKYISNGYKEIAYLLWPNYRLYQLRTLKTTHSKGPNRFLLNFLSIWTLCSYRLKTIRLLSKKRLKKRIKRSTTRNRLKKTFFQPMESVRQNFGKI